MRILGRLTVSLVAVLGVTYLASQVATSGAADVAASTPLVAVLPAAPAPTPTTVAPATTTTVAPTTTTSIAPPAPTPTIAAAKAKAPITTASVSAPVLAKTAPAPAPAPAPTPATPQAMGAAALELIDYPWERLGYSLSFEGPQDGLLGKTTCATKSVYVYVRPSQTVRQVAFVTAFELGHAIDCGTMTDARRAEWAAIRGFAPGWTWFPSCLCTEDSFGSGDISMVFADWLVPDGGYGWRSNLAGPPGASITDLMPYLRPDVVR